MIADSEAMAAIEGSRLDEILGSAEVVNLQDEPARSSFNAYRIAFRENEAEPKLKNAVRLVRAWNAFAAVVGIEQHVVEPVTIRTTGRG